MLIVQECEIVQKIVGYALRLCLWIKRVEFLGDLLDGVHAIAQLDNFETRAAETKFTPWHEQQARLLVLLVQADSRSQLRCCGKFRFDHASSLERDLERPPTKNPTYKNSMAGRG